MKDKKPMFCTVVDPSEYDIARDVKRLITIANKNKEMYAPVDVGKFIGLYEAWKEQAAEVERLRQENGSAIRVGGRQLGEVCRLKAKIEHQEVEKVIKELEEARGIDVQIEELANFIMAEVDGEPSKNEGAVECAIRIIAEQAAKIERLRGIIKNEKQKVKRWRKEAQGHEVERLRESIERHRQDVWGDGVVEHVDDVTLYEVLK